MKQIIISVGLILIAGVQSLKAQQQKFTETIQKDITFETRSSENSLVLQNLNGSIKVEGYEGNTVQLTVEKTIKARSAEKLELRKQEIGLKVEQQGSEIIIYPKIPNLTFKEGHLSTINCNTYDHRPGYDHTLNFTVRIPNTIRVEEGTVNHGDVEINNTSGDFIKAVNVNGHITLNNVSGQTDVNAINGEVNISYARNPKAPSKYYALNGDIHIKYQKDLSAEIAFKSMNGELYTDFDIAKQYAKTRKSNSGKTKFKYEAKPVVQIGAGGIDHSFETLNGDVIIKKI